MISEKTNGQPKQSRDSVYDSPRLDAPPARSSLWWLWLIVAIVVLGVGGWLIVRWHNSSVAAANADRSGAGGKGGKGGLVPVVVSKAHKGSIGLYLNGLGTATALNTASIHSRVDGQLEKILYTEGQTVQVGDLLCEIDPRPFQAMLSQAKGQLARDQALLKDAAANLKRYQDLMKENLSVTQAQVDTQQALVDQYQGSVDTDNGVKQADEVNLAYCEIRAPIAGRIGLRLVDPGNIVHAADASPLAVITQVQPITVIFTIAEDDIPKVMAKYDPKNPMTVEAWNRDVTTKLATGKVVAIDNQVDATTGTVKIRAIFDNAKNELFPNEFTNARLLVDTLHDVIIVPAAAVQRGPDSTFVYVVTTDAAAKEPTSTVDIRNITLGATEGDQTVIETGLVAGEIVVTDGVDKLVKGTVVKTAERPKKKGAATQPGATQPADTQPAGEATTQPVGASTRPAGSGEGLRIHHPQQAEKAIGEHAKQGDA